MLVVSPRQGICSARRIRHLLAGYSGQRERLINAFAIFQHEVREVVRGWSVVGIDLQGFSIHVLSLLRPSTQFFHGSGEKVRGDVSWIIVDRSIGGCQGLIAL